MLYMCLCMWAWWSMFVEVCESGEVGCICRSSVLDMMQDGWTPLNVAADKGRSEVVNLLLEKRADMEAKNNVSVFCQV